MECQTRQQFPLSSQTDRIEACISSLETISDQETAEKIIIQTFETAPDNICPDSHGYYSVLNYQLYRYVLKHYKQKESRVCLWRFIKNLSGDQLQYANLENPELRMMDWLIRLYFYSDPLDDLTCIFIPISDKRLIRKYLYWIKNYFYDANYPSSLLWLYALDSSLSSLLPDEIIYLGRAVDSSDENIMVPMMDYGDTVLIKRFSAQSDHYVLLKEADANNEFRQIFTFLQQEYRDRCLSRSGKQDEAVDKATYNAEWEKFEDVLRFGVSDEDESGCISFSDMRASTEFLNTYGKTVYLNKIQQPFFEKTKLISKKYNGRIDKFMGDNVMSVFLNKNMHIETHKAQEREAVLKNFLALFALCKTLYELIVDGSLTESRLGLRSGVTYGSQLLRSNLGNEILRDFTVTGESVNLAARLEHISAHELIIHNKMYFKRSIERFPQISELIAIDGCQKNISPETENIIRDFTLYQNILSNLEKLETVKFDIRSNQRFYTILRTLLQEKGYPILNTDTSEIYGYEEYDIRGFCLRFYFSHYNPKGFANYEKIWIVPLDLKTLEHFDIESIA
ncbi:MAG: hypothetical protein DRI57_28740 [Deltaproteobacteria bacterium]|nr:MAG: hypothetical protein DRI57_28740 [Deltaproteobacteria bacterium]